MAPLEADEALAEYDTPWGDTARARTTSGASVVVWNDTPVDVEVHADPLTLAERGDEVGTAVVRAGSQEITVPLVLDASLDGSRHVVAPRESRRTRLREHGEVGTIGRHDPRASPPAAGGAAQSGSE